MEVLTKAEVLLRKKELVGKVKLGVVFIHPTDTIYWLGSSAFLFPSVQKIRDLKDRPTNPFSVWAPSVEWIKQNCVMTPKAEKWLAKLPGPYTLLLKLKQKKTIATNVAPGRDVIGVRIPKHWFSDIVREAGIPIVTTSANKAGQPFMTTLESLDPEVQKGVDFIIYEGPKEGHPSTIVDVEREELKERS